MTGATEPADEALEELRGAWRRHRAVRVEGAISGWFHHPALAART